MNRELKERLTNAVVWTTLTITISFILSLLVLYFEKGSNPNFQTVEDGYWWWILTISGLGFGHEPPTTFMGTILASVVVFSGLFLFAMVISQVTAVIRVWYEKRQIGIIRISYKDHIVIYGYTSLTAGVIKLLRRHFGKELKIVVVSNDIRRNPFEKEVDFLYGNPISKDVFIEANTREASAAIILANDRFINPDAYSLVIASSIEKINSKVVTLVEIVDNEMKDLFKQSNVDAFIDRKELLKDLIQMKDDAKIIRVINKETTLDEEILESEKIGLV